MKIKKIILKIGVKINLNWIQIDHYKNGRCKNDK